MTINKWQDVPGIRAAMENDNITYIDIPEEESNPTITEGFTDTQIQEMSEEGLHAQLNQIGNEELALVQMQTDLNTRRTKVMNILKRKSELT